MIYSEKQEGQGSIRVWTSNPANREIYSYLLEQDNDHWKVVSKEKSYKRDHPRFNEKTELEPDSSRAVREHVEEEYGIRLKN